MNAPAVSASLTPSSLEQIPITAIRPSTTQIQRLRRSHFDPTKLDELVASIESQGLLQPILVRPVAPDGITKYELVAGERRWIAAERAGLAHIDCNVRALTDDQVIEAQLIENLQREDIHPLEEAEGYHELMALKRITAAEVGELVGKSRSWVYARLRLRDLTGPAADALQHGEIDASRALLVARIGVPKLQEKALKLALEKSWNDEQFRLSYRRLKEELARLGCTVSLKTAPWALDDTTFFRFEKVPGRRGQEDAIQLPACVDCPFRAGNCSDQATGDDPDVCTNHACFDLKLKEHGARVRKTAEAQGVPVLDGEDAKKIAPRRDKLVGFIDLDEQCDDDNFTEPEPEPKDDAEEDSPGFEARHAAWQRRYEEHQGRTFRQLLADVLTAGKLDVKLLEDPKTKRVRELVPVKPARALLAEKHDIKLPGYVGQAEPKRTGGVDYKAQNAKWEEERRKREEREEREVTYRRQVLKAIAEKCAGPLKREDLVEVADALLEDTHGIRRGLASAGVYPKLPEPSALKDPELGKLIRLLLVAEGCSYAGRTPKPLLALAKRYKVDINKIRRELEKDDKPATDAAAPAPKKKAKAKGKKK